MSTNEILAQHGEVIRSAKEELNKQQIKRKGESPLTLKMTPYVTLGDRMAAVKACIIPEAYAECKFDPDKIRKNITDMNAKAARKFEVTNLSNYLDFANGLLTLLEAKKLPSRSYIIGAPNGFGKTSLANDCILTLFKQGKICTPYVSLTELAQVRLATDKELLNGMQSVMVYRKGWFDTSSESEYNAELYKNIDSEQYEKRPINIVSKFSYSEYLNSALLFCYFSDVRSKQIESEMLKTLLTIRASKGLATIAMISTSINVYTKDPYLSQYVWDDILEYNPNGESFDRVKHISCYKNYYVPLKA